MKVIFIRHGFAEHNKAFLERGEECFYDESLRYSDLTTEGRLQASMINLPVLPEIVLTSSLPRALSTTSIIFGNATKVIVSDLIRETNFHHIVNSRRSRSEIALKYPRYDTSSLNEEDGCISSAAFAAPDPINGRCKNLTEMLQNLYYNGYRYIAIVSHHTFLKKYFQLERNLTVDLDNCGTITLEYNF